MPPRRPLPNPGAATVVTFPMLRFLLPLLLLAASASAATIDRVREAGVLRCGGAARPGLAAPAANGEMAGLEVDLCRAVAAAVLGDHARIEFHPYALDKDFDRLRRGEDAVAFLTGSELLAGRLLDAVVPGPAVFHLTNGVMVAADSPARHLSDLVNTMVCAEPGTGPERTLLAYFRDRGQAVSFSGWQEEEEMLDAFEVGRCPAVALEITSLAAQRADGAVRKHPIRILPEPLAATPVLAVTGLDDARWAATVAWVVQTVMQPHPGALPVRGEALGLLPGWQGRALAGGAYPALLDRNLGAASPLQLPPALDGPWREGGLLCPPGAE